MPSSISPCLITPNNKGAILMDQKGMFFDSCIMDKCISSQLIMENSMKLFIVPLILLALSGSVFASDWATSDGSCYGKGNLSVGVGFSLVYPGAFVTADYGVHDAISAGIATGYNGKDYLGYRVNFFSIYARSAFHPFNLKVLAERVSVRNKLDPYAGLAIGFSGEWISNHNTKYSSSLNKWSPVRELLGAKLYPISNLYIMAEEGGGLSVFNFGVGYKF